jgi:hypothetical protein
MKIRSAPPRMTVLSGMSSSVVVLQWAPGFSFHTKVVRLDRRRGAA